MESQPVITCSKLTIETLDTISAAVQVIIRKRVLQVILSQHNPNLKHLSMIQQVIYT